MIALPSWVGNIPTVKAKRGQSVADSGNNRSLTPQVVSAGLVTGLLSVIFAVSYGTVIFAGPLAPHSALGINLALYSSAIVGLVIAVKSSHRGTISGVSDTAVILGLIAVEMQMVNQDMDILPTFLVTIALTTILTGVVLWLLGRFRSGGLARYIPFPVMGGFLAGIGWLMLKGSITSMTSIQPGLENLGALVQPELAVKWGPGVILGLLIFIFGRKHFTAAILIAMASAFVLFWMVAILLGIPIENLRDGGWLLGPFKGGMPEMHIDHVGALPKTDWLAIIAQAPKIGGVVVTTLIGLLLTAASLELTTRSDIDLNRELRAAGLGNIFSGLAGGMVGFHYLSSSNLVYRMRGNHRVVGIVNAAVCFAAIAAGAMIFSFVPKIMAGTLLVALGASFLHTWLIQSCRRMHLGDYGVLLIVFVVVVFVGFIEGIVVGLVVGGVLFVINYSRIDIVKAAVSGQSWSSNVDRAEPVREVLRRRGDAIFVLALQGFLFFGTANRLLRRVRKRLEEADRPAVKYVVIDFRWTHGLDSSVALTFKRLCQYAEDRQFELCLTSLRPDCRATLEREGLRQDRRQTSGGPTDGAERRGNHQDSDDDGCRFFIFSDLDHGLEWCEERLLESDDHSGTGVEMGLADLLTTDFRDAGLVRQFLDHAELVTFEAGEVVIEEGSDGDDIFFIETGRVSIRLAVEGGETVRVKSLGPGSSVGELALYAASPRSASVFADQSTTAYRVTREGLDRMRAELPEVVACFHEHMARHLAKRLDDTTRLLAAMVK